MESNDDDRSAILTASDADSALGFTFATYAAACPRAGASPTRGTRSGWRIAKDVDDGAGGSEVTAYVYDGADILMEFGTGPGS